jgi:hypothetical protein
VRFLEALVYTFTGVCDTTPKGQGDSWPKQTPWPKDGTQKTPWPTDGTPGPKGDGSHWTDLL